MILNMAGVVLFLSVCGIVNSSPHKAVDCRKFVFAPLCRGVAAKRGDTDIGRYEQDMYRNEEKYPLKLPHSVVSLLGAPLNENDQIDELMSPQRFARLYRQKQRNDISKMLLENERSNSERDNLHEQEFGDL